MICVVGVVNLVSSGLILEMRKFVEKFLEMLVNVVLMFVSGW